MGMHLDEIVPFGRSLDEYQQMFNLSEQDLRRHIVGVGDGPAGFNAEMTARGYDVMSVDPLYIASAEEIARRFFSCVDSVIDQVKATPGDWVSTYHASPDVLKATRIQVFKTFIEDYERGKREGRYVCGELPVLGFAEGRFDLALCSHFLFLYSDHLTYEFHRKSVLDMLRIADEVRIFPLLTLLLNESPYSGPLIRGLESHGFVVNVQTVRYELQRGGNEMLRISKAV